MRKSKHEGNVRIKFFTWSLISDTFKNALYLASFHRETFRDLVRKININPITGSVKNIVSLEKMYLKIYMNNKINTNNIQKRHRPYVKMRSQEHQAVNALSKQVG